MRSVPEWRGKTDDAKVPARVRLRIWDRCLGRCYITGYRIYPGDKYEYDHIIALALGGQHREGNIALVLSGVHKEKSRNDRRLQAKSDRIRKRHAGIKKPRKITGWKNFRGEPVRASRDR